MVGRWLHLDFCSPDFVSPLAMMPYSSRSPLTKAAITLTMQGTTPTAQLPTELWHIVIDFLQHDNTTLKSCGLVRRDWLSAARRHLFRTLEVFPDGSSYGGIHNLLRFLKTCDDARAYLRDLTLNCAAMVRSSQTPEQFSASYLYSAVSSLPGLKRLTIIGLAFDDFPVPVEKRLAISTLDLIGCRHHNDDISTVANIIRMFSSIETLSVEGYFSRDATFKSSNGRILPQTEIRHLMCDTIGTEPLAVAYLYDIVDHTESPGSTLESIHFCWQSWSDLEASGRLLTKAGPGLRALELELTEEFLEDGMPGESQWFRGAPLLLKPYQ